ELFHNTQNLGAKSDILRYEILNKFGGIYVDLDFLFIKSFDDILHLEFFAGNGHVKLPEIFNSIIGSKPKSKIILSIVEGLKNKTKIDNSINGVMYGTGPYYITKIFYDNVNENDNVIIFPTKYFFSFPGIKRHLSKNFNNNIDYIKSYMNNNTYCIHLWHTAWQK
ncbi:MAG: glycosyltransferase, partial [bacterium]